MNASRYPIPRYVDVLLDLDAIRTSAKADPGYRTHKAWSGRSSARAKFAALTITGTVAGAIVGTAFAFAPSGHSGTGETNGNAPISGQLKRNTDALRRSQMWWEGYGQRHLQSRRDHDRLSEVTD